MKFLNSIFDKPYSLLKFAVLLGGCLTIIVLINPVLFRDSVNYIASVNAVWLQNWHTAFNITYVPFLFVTASCFKLIGLNALQSLTLLSSLLAICTLFPAYRILSSFMDRKAAAWGSILFFLSSPVMDCSFAPLTDSGRFFFMLASLMIIIDFIKSEKKILLVLLGVVYTFFALTRSEGIVFVGLISLWFFIELLRKDRCWKEWKKCCADLWLVVIPLLLMLILLLPRLWQMMSETGFPALDTRQTWAIKAFLNKIFPDFVPTDSSIITYGSNMNYHSFWTDTQWHCRYWRNFFTGNWFPYTAFSIIGFYRIIRDKQWHHFHTLFCVFVVVNAFIYMLMRSCAGRYFLINTFFLMPFTIYGITFVWQKVLAMCSIKWRQQLTTFLPCFMAVIVIALFCKGIAQSFSSKTSHYPIIGKFMKGQVQTGEFRSQSKYPVYFILGSNYGWGVFCNGNEIVYSPHFNIQEKFSIEYILQSGLPSEYCSFAVENLKDLKILKPDYVIDSRKKRNFSVECLNMLEPIPQKISNRVDIYRVKDANEQAVK